MSDETEHQDDELPDSQNGELSEDHDLDAETTEPKPARRSRKKKRKANTVNVSLSEEAEDQVYAIQDALRARGVRKNVSVSRVLQLALELVSPENKRLKTALATLEARDGRTRASRRAA